MPRRLDRKRNIGQGAVFGAFDDIGDLGALLPSYTALGPATPQALTALPTPINQAVILTAVVPVGQKLIIIYTIEIDAVEGAGDAAFFINDNATAGETRNQTVATAGAETFSLSIEVLGGGVTHAISLVVSNAGATLSVPANTCRVVVQTVPG
jgi:hypothetical protein